MVKKFTEADWERFAEEQVCEICGAPAASITKHDQRCHKSLCEHHSKCKPIIVCCDCGKPFPMKMEYYLPRWREGRFEDWYCQTCHRKRNAEHYRGSDAQKAHLKALNPAQILRDWYADPNNKDAIAAARSKRYDNHPELREVSAAIGRANICKTFLSPDNIARVKEMNATIMPDKRWGPIVKSITGCEYRTVPLASNYGLTPEDLAAGVIPPCEFCPNCGNPIPVVDGRLVSKFCSDGCGKAAFEKSNAARLDKIHGPIVTSINGFTYREKPLLAKFGLTAEDLEAGKFPPIEICKICGSAIDAGYEKSGLQICSDACWEVAKAEMHEKSTAARFGPKVFSCNGFAYRAIPLFEKWGLTELNLANGAFPESELCPECGKILAPNENGRPISRFCSDACRAAALSIDLISWIEEHDWPDTPSTPGSPIDASNAASFTGYQVWCKIDADDGSILDVMATSNLSKEYETIVAWLADPSLRPGPKYAGLSKHTVTFASVCACDSWEAALIAETAFAVESGAVNRFWNPAPEQFPIVELAATRANAAIL